MANDDVAMMMMMIQTTTTTEERGRRGFGSYSSPVMVGK